MDLSTLTVVQLRELQQRIPGELKKRESKEKGNVLNKLKALAQSHGYSLEQLLEKEVAVKKTRGTVKIKYRHPQDASLTWTGRGRTPKWVTQWQASGGTLENLLV